MLESLPPKVLEAIFENVSSLGTRLGLERVSRRVGHAARSLAWAAEGTLEVRPVNISLLKMNSVQLSLLAFPASAERERGAEGLGREVPVPSLPLALEALLERCGPWLQDLRLTGSNDTFLFPVPSWASSSVELSLDFGLPLRRLYLSHVFALAPSAASLIAASPHLAALHFSLPADFYGEERSAELAGAVAKALTAAEACHRLEELVLELSQNQRLSDGELGEVLKDKPLLRRLQLLKVRGLSGAGLRLALAESGAQLELFRLSLCPGLDLGALLESSPEDPSPLRSLRQVRFCPAESDGEFLGPLGRLAAVCPALERVDFAHCFPAGDADSLGALVAGFLQQHGPGRAARRLDIQAHCNLVLSTQGLSTAVGRRVACASALTQTFVPFYNANEYSLLFTAGKATVSFTFCLDREA